MPEKSGCLGQADWVNSCVAAVPPPPVAFDHCTVAVTSGPNKLETSLRDSVLAGDEDSAVLVFNRRKVLLLSNR